MFYRQKGFCVLFILSLVRREWPVRIFMRELPSPANHSWAKSPLKGTEYYLSKLLSVRFTILYISSNDIQVRLLMAIKLTLTINGCNSKYKVSFNQNTFLQNTVEWIYCNTYSTTVLVVGMKLLKSGLLALGIGAERFGRDTDEDHSVS